MKLHSSQPFLAGGRAHSGFSSVYLNPYAEGPRGLLPLTSFTCILRSPEKDLERSVDVGGENDVPLGRKLRVNGCIIKEMLGMILIRASKRVSIGAQLIIGMNGPGAHHHGEGLRQGLPVGFKRGVGVPEFRWYGGRGRKVRGDKSLSCEGRDNSSVKEREVPSCNVSREREKGVKGVREFKQHAASVFNENPNDEVRS